MIKDLRRIINKIAIRVNPSDCRNKDVHLLLSDYLYKELKSEGINVKRNNVNLIVSFKNNTKLVIDCLDGNIYMDDKSIGKLRRFNMNRSGEAYDCAVQNAKRIINKIKGIQNEINNDNVIFKSALSIKDHRKMKKFASDIVSDRECAIVVVDDNNIIEGRTHAEAISNYLVSIGKPELEEKYCRPNNNDLNLSIEEINERIEYVSDNIKKYLRDAINIKENIKSLGFAHKMKDYTIQVESYNWNCDQRKISYELKEYYRDYDILNYDNLRKIADLRKTKKTICDLRRKKNVIADLRKSKIVITDLRKNK